MCVVVLNYTMKKLCADYVNFFFEEREIYAKYVMWL